MNNLNNKRGFIALTLVLTISSLLLAFAFTKYIDIGHFFDMTKNKEYRLISYYRAYNCIDQAILNLAHDYFYVVSASKHISELGCYIDLVENINNHINIETHSDYKNITVKRRAKVILYDNRIEISSIE